MSAEAKSDAATEAAASDSDMPPSTSRQAFVRKGGQMYVAGAKRDSDDEVVGYSYFLVDILDWYKKKRRTNLGQVKFTYADALPDGTPQPLPDGVRSRKELTRVILRDKERSDFRSRGPEDKHKNTWGVYQPGDSLDNQLANPRDIIKDFDEMGRDGIKHGHRVLVESLIVPATEERFKDIQGLESAKHFLREHVIAPLMMQETSTWSMAEKETCIIC